MDIDLIEDVTQENVKPGFFESLRDDLKRYGAFIRDKFWEIVERIRGKFQQLGSKLSNYFNG